jgi:hypothetical protein
MQPIFHDARYQGLYGSSLRKVKQKKGLGADEQLLDRAGALELSANDFQMSLAADVIVRENIKGEIQAINVNRKVGDRVRGVISESIRNDARRFAAGNPNRRSQTAANLSKEKAEIAVTFPSASLPLCGRSRLGVS